MHQNPLELLENAQLPGPRMNSLTIIQKSGTAQESCFLTRFSGDS